MEAGRTVIVGVNRFADGEAPPIVPAPDFGRLEAAQRAQLAGVRASRDGAAVATALDEIRRIAPSYLGGDGPMPLMPAIIDAVRARASVGEISDVLRAVWGEHRPG